MLHLCGPQAVPNSIKRIIDRISHLDVADLGGKDQGSAKAELPRVERLAFSPPSTKVSSNAHPRSTTSCSQIHAAILITLMPSV